MKVVNKDRQDDVKERIKEGKYGGGREKEVK
jgi:hypothetical protein